MRVMVLALLLGSALAAQEKPPPPPGVDDYKVDQAIKKGIAFLHGNLAESKDWRKSDELLLWTFIHADVPETDARFKQLLKKVLEAPLEKTYRVALTAMCFEEIDRVKYQYRIAQCAQFIVDNQCENGQWGYGSPTAAVASIPKPEEKVATESKGEGVKNYAAPADKAKPKVTQKVVIVRSKEGPASGDNSNTQYAALGLRACHDAGIIVPEMTILLAVKWWRESQFKAEKKDNAVATGGSGNAEGWNYKSEGVDKRNPYHAMTAGGVGSLTIYEYIRRRDWKRDSGIKAGINWLTEHYTVKGSYYYLYSLERAGLLYGTEKLGDHFWYVDGAKAIIAAQKPDGSWSNPKKDEEFRVVWDTCFAILFLKRATRPLVETQSAGKK